MKRFFSKLFDRDKDSCRKAPVAEVLLVAERKTWGGNFTHLDHWNRRNLIPITLDVSRPEYWRELKDLILAAKMTAAQAESWRFCWDFDKSKSEALGKFATNEVLLRVWPSNKFVKPESAEFYDALCLYSSPGQHVEIFCVFDPEGEGLSPARR